MVARSLYSPYENLEASPPLLTGRTKGFPRSDRISAETLCLLTSYICSTNNVAIVAAL